MSARHARGPTVLCVRLRIDNKIFVAGHKISNTMSSVCRLSVTFVRPTQPVEIFGNVSAPFDTLASC